jgi:transcription termination factor NusB
MICRSRSMVACAIDEHVTLWTLETLLLLEVAVLQVTSVSAKIDSALVDICELVAR